MDVRATFLQACRLACMATNKVLVNSSLNMPALCAARAVLHEATVLRELRPDVEDLRELLPGREGRRLEAAVALMLQQTLHDSVTGEARMVEAFDIDLLLTSDPADALNEFYDAFDVLSLQDTIHDFDAKEVEAAVRSVLELVEAANGVAGVAGVGEGGILDYLPVLLSDSTDPSRHPLREEGFGVYRAGLTPLAAQVYGLLTLSVLYDLANDEFRQGTSLFSDRFSSEFHELTETFTMDDVGTLVGVAIRVYGMLVSGEVTL